VPQVLINVIELILDVPEPRLRAGIKFSLDLIQRKVSRGQELACFVVECVRYSLELLL
jgi:hypothetical protein